VIDACDYVEVVQVIDTGWSSDVALNGIQDALERNADINAIYSHSDFMMQGVIEGLRLKNRLVPAGEEGHIVTASIDGDPVGLQGIRDGYIDMIGENSPMVTVGVALNVVLAELYGQKDYEDVYVLPVAAITAENVDDPALWGNVEKGQAPYIEQDVFPLPSRG
jgi:ABC-type sugar transport system substrate-binding protein